MDSKRRNKTRLCSLTIERDFNITNTGQYKLTQKEYSKIIINKFINTYKNINKLEEVKLWYKRNEKTQNSTKREKIKLFLWRICDFCFFKPTPTIFSFWRISLLRLFGATIGKGCYISPKATILIPWNLKMGNICSIDD